jgi:hypothetical protein
MAQTWVTRKMVFLFHLSAATPPTGDRMKVGIWLANPTTPSRTGDPVRRYTSQLVAMRCIQVPIKDVPCPRKNSL